MKKLTFIALVILMLVKTCFAEEDERWLFIGKDIYGNNYIDIKSIELYKSSQIKVWVKTIYSEKGKKRDINERKKRKLPIYPDLYATVYGLIVDCNTKKLGVFSLNDYTKNGEILDSSDIPESSVSLKSVDPGSIGEKIINNACYYFWNTKNKSSKKEDIIILGALAFLISLILFKKRLTEKDENHFTEKNEICFTEKNKTYLPENGEIYFTKENEKKLIEVKDVFSNEKYYINPNSIKPYKDLQIKVWTKRIFFEEKEEPPLQFPREAIVGWIIDCNTRKAGIFSLTFYDKNGKILHPSSKRYEPEFLVSLEPVEPYSIEEK
ncbi:MAG: surface-adhesin E family protein [Minisyncoccia bacterium]|jgi:hypothetical protein